MDLVFRIGDCVHSANAKRKSHVHLGLATETRPRNRDQSEWAKSTMKDVALFLSTSLPFLNILWYAELACVDYARRRKCMAARKVFSGLLWRSVSAKRVALEYRMKVAVVLRNKKRSHFSSA